MIRSETGLCNCKVGPPGQCRECLGSRMEPSTNDSPSGGALMEPEKRMDLDVGERCSASELLARLCSPEEELMLRWAVCSEAPLVLDRLSHTVWPACLFFAD